ncbi:hypothetical protein ACFYM3_34205 [Streptomyces massasporeus]|uniref:MarR family transcriptional regulator n=1 Tax=Streptomyces massasporeus TaxID=67324 RepID=A0ABW6LN18_9ACTN
MALSQQGREAHAADLLAAPRATPDQLRFLLHRIHESLTDVHRIARSRRSLA